MRVLDALDSRQVASAVVASGAWVPVALAEATCVLATVYGLSAEESGRAIEMLVNHRDLAKVDGAQKL